MKEINAVGDFAEEESLFMAWTEEKLPKIIQKADSKNKDVIADILFIRKNILDYNKVPRENIMFSNFKYLCDRFNLKEQKIYGYFGEAHVLQKPMGEKMDFGALVNQDKDFKDKTYTIISRYADSEMAAPSKFLPFFLRSGKEHTKSGISCDNPFLLYHSGISELKQLTVKNTNTFFDISQLNSPYSKSQRLMKSFGFLSLISGMKITDENLSTCDYAQGVLLIRNSEWAQPQ